MLQAIMRCQILSIRQNVESHNLIQKGSRVELDAPVGNLQRS